MSDLISRQAAIEAFDGEISVTGRANAEAVRGYVNLVRDRIKRLPAADVVEVHAVIRRMNKERKRAKGNWHTDPYWLGWVDAMRRAERIVDGTIDDEPMYAPSTGEKKEDKKG